MANEDKAPYLRCEGVSLAPRRLASDRAAKGSGFSLEAAYLLHNISFEVFPGDRISLIGPSGAGKTSLLRLLNRLSEPTRGQIYWHGLPLNQAPVTQLRQQVVLVLQETKLLGMTVQKALEYPLTLQNLDQKTIRQRVEAWIERLHIPIDWLGRTELQLSVGQRQLVAIARALVMHPKVLLLDEPTSALDAGRAKLLLEVLVELAETQGTCVLMVNHQLELAEQFCQRLLQLHQGNLFQDISQEQADWRNVRESLLRAEAEQVEEWG